MTGQNTIDLAIGSLATDPLNFTYLYDALGNRLEERRPGLATVVQVPNVLNQAASVDGVPQSFDLNGNLIDDGGRTYRYNYRNQLIEVRHKTPDAELARLVYDAQGRLAALREGGQELHLINDGVQVVEEYTSAGIARQYVYGNGVDRHCQLAAAGEEWWFHRDAIGSTRWLSDSVGQVAANSAFAYDAFGNTVGGALHECRYLFTGRRLLGAAEVYDFRARHYLPRLGRFLQRDPTGAVDGPNLYQYAGNNPVTLVDPMGTQKGTADSEEPKPLAEEYFRGYKPSVEEQAQVGGLIRALLYLNPVALGSPETVKKTEEMAERLMPFAYAPQDQAKAKHYEQGWEMIFSMMLNMWQFAAGAEQSAMTMIGRRAAANLAVSEAAIAGRQAARNAPRLVPFLARTPAGEGLMPEITITFRESVVISDDILQANPILQDLAAARRAGNHDAVWDIMRRFREETGIQTQVLAPNQMSASNPMSLTQRPGFLQVRQGLAQDPARFARELQHEMNAYYSSQYYRDLGLGRSEILWTPRTEGPPGMGWQNHVLDMITNAPR
jgi:RHS repeat-associated protein